jgi:hypothetical protein
MHRVALQLLQTKLADRSHRFRAATGVLQAGQVYMWPNVLWGDIRSCQHRAAHPENGPLRQTARSRILSHVGRFLGGLGRRVRARTPSTTSAPSSAAAGGTYQFAQRNGSSQVGACVT